MANDPYAGTSFEGIGPPKSIGDILSKTRKQKNVTAAETTRPYQQYLEQAQAALPRMYEPAFRSVSNQFRPEFARARSYLAGNPAVANSGLANRLNRQLHMSAIGGLQDQIGQTTAGAYGGGLDLLSQLIRRRMEAQQQERLQKKQQGGIGGGLGGLVGGGLGMIGGPVLGAVGQKIGSKINPGAIY
jgi:hypothetical protein